VRQEVDWYVAKKTHMQSKSPVSSVCATCAKALVLFSLLSIAAYPADKSTAPQLIGMARSADPNLAAAISVTIPAEALKKGTAWVGRGPEFFFAIDSKAAPEIVIDGNPGPAMQRAAGSELWYAVAQIQPPGTAHSFHYLVDGATLGGSSDVPVFGPLSLRQAGVPEGTLLGPTQHSSKIYDGMKSDYWVYVPAQYEPSTPAALMVFQDGKGYLDREGNNPALNVVDNLIAQKQIPVTICVFVMPGDISGAAGTPTYNFVKAYGDKWGRTLSDSMRSTLYDTVSDRYARFLRDEVLAEVQAKYNIRKDAYSRAILGISSGGICAFNAAWQMTGEFSRVIAWIGSFVSIQWKEDPNVTDGGQDYPEKVLREPKRNIRVWLQDGSQDMESSWFGIRYGSWPLANVRMATALKLTAYDFHFSFGTGTHNSAGGAAEFPAELIWLWRDYDPGKTQQVYEMEASEKAKPLFRISIVNRDVK
jgi:enterochelin esterase family protein